MEQVTSGKEYTRLLVMKPLRWGLTAAMTLLAVFFIILTLANSPAHALEEFMLIWPWITFLIFGFGLQAGLYAYIRTASRLRAKGGAASAMVASGGISTSAMAACCLHHVTDVLPILGLSAAAIFLARYQNIFLLVGILSNLIGINLMLKIIQDGRLYRRESGILPVLMRFNMTRTLIITGLISLVALTIVLVKTINTFSTSFPN